MLIMIFRQAQHRCRKEGRAGGRPTTCKNAGNFEERSKESGVDLPTPECNAPGPVSISALCDRSQGTLWDLMSGHIKGLGSSDHRTATYHGHKRSDRDRRGQTEGSGPSASGPEGPSVRQHRTGVRRDGQLGAGQHPL